MGVASRQKAVAVALSIKLRQQELLRQAEELLLKDPPPVFEYITESPSISAFDLDTVKLTAQFVARNGRQFLTSLMNKEHRNSQFDFLRPHHAMFQYFTKLLEQYTKVLIPAKDMIANLGVECVNASCILEQVKHRAEWIRCKDAQSRREDELLERERVAYAQIDWHDFVVVETVEYLVGDVGNFPPPTTPHLVGTRILMQERMEESENTEEEKSSDDNGVEHIEEENEHVVEENTSEKESEEALSKEDERKDSKDNNQIEDMEEDSETEEQLVPPPTPTCPVPLTLAPTPPDPDTVIVKRDYDPKQIVRTMKPKVPEEFLISPITGETIPANKVQEHIRIGLLDPQWVEQRDKQLEEKLNQESVYVPGSAIGASLKLLAERRTDIFGVGDEETGIGKKIGEEEKKEDKVTWDGHTSSVEAATRAARANITIEDQIHQIHKVKGLLPDEEKERIGPKHVACPPPLPPPLPAQPPPLPPPTRILPPHPSPIMIIPPIMSPMMVPQPRPQFNMIQVVPPPTMLPTFVPLVTQMHQPLLMHQAEERVSEPPAKKMRTEESLIPEHVFLGKTKSPVTFAVTVPQMPERTEWKLKGQVLTVTLPLSDSVSVIKAKIYEATQVPPGKQKLHWEGMFFKDTNSLAFYNISPATTIQLQIKERGGRKK
ncbi:splicing factor 3A subunit 1 isoform X3 [Homalodisca vitripennis]|nr:splicing factor 3A subunit 1 isoform X3 [Homalodisca vitripennis]